MSLAEEDAMETTQRLPGRGSGAEAAASAAAAAVAVATQPDIFSLHRPCVTRMGIALLVLDPIGSNVGTRSEAPRSELAASSRGSLSILGDALCPAPIVSQLSW
jgi:hypothetical protein